MRHLSAESLARLVDEAAGAEEREHLRSCPRCAAELRALRDQTEALSSLPDVRPPSGDWHELERRLRAEGLIGEEETDSARLWHLLPARNWLQAVAALVLFLGGAGVGAMASQAVQSGPPARPVAESAAEFPARNVRTVDAAEEALRSAEERYVDALIQYRSLLDVSDGDADTSTDPASRFAALETLVAASRAAIREAPADPFLNGVLASSMAEREAALRRISTSDEENWF